MAEKNIRLKNAAGDILHPETIASIVLTDTEHKFVTDAEKQEWASKLDVEIVTGDLPAGEENVLYVKGGLLYLLIEGTLQQVGGKSAVVTLKDIDLGADKASALAEITNPSDGDFAIIRETISGDKKEYTAYIYASDAWQALDGNYNAENVYFDKDLVTTSAVGNITLTNGQATISAAGKNLKQVFDTIFVQEKNPNVTQPSASVSCPQAKAYEVGTSVTPSFTVSFNKGSYQYGPADTGVTVTSYSVTDTNSSPAVTASTGSFAELTVGDGTNYRIIATVNYGAGDIPLTNVGNEYAAGQIKAGSKVANSSYITGYRAWFYGSSTSAITTDSASIRALTNKGVCNKGNVSVPVVEGAKCVLIAVPQGRTVTKVADQNAFGTDIFSAFTSSQISVEGANGYTAQNYNVYVYLPDAALGANTYVITIA